jgi:dienelactone hydrolase
MTMTRCVFPLLLVVCTPFALSAPAIDLTPAAGPHAVGIRVVQQYDHSRGTAREPDIFGQSKFGERPRPMQTLVWYPAQASTSGRMRYLDYLKSSLTEDDFELPAAAIAQQSAKWTAGPAASSARVRQAMLGVRDARPASGQFPVLIYAPSFAAPAAENADLCEYLASHGYIVLASGSRGARSKTMTDDVEGLESQAADIAYLASYAQTLPSADMDKLAVVGFSWGGLANVYAAARSSRVKALVSLDGSLRTYPELIAATSYLTPARAAVPMLSIGSRPDSIERLNERKKSTATSFLNSMKYADVYLATMQPMEHMHFSGMSLRLDPDSSFGDYTRDELAVAHSWTGRYVREFLDAYLKKDAAAMAFLKNAPQTNGVPPHVMRMSRRPASALLPSEESFVAEFKRRGFQGALPIYEGMRKDEPGFTLHPIKLNKWGYQLLGKGDPKGAIELFKLAIAIEPEWGAVQDSLGEAYEAVGEKTLAIAAYERALQLDPKIGSAAQRLKALR